LVVETEAKEFSRDDLVGGDDRADAVSLRCLLIRSDGIFGVSEHPVARSFANIENLSTSRISK